jgi:hypothetical protein
MVWTQFWDMHSGGGQKLDWPMIYIEAPEAEAKSVFYARFGANPERVSCTCCGDDYSIHEGESLEQLTGYHRNLRHVSPLARDKWFDAPIEERRKANELSRYLEPGEPVPDGWHVDERFRHQKEQSLEDYLASGVKVIRAEEIEDHERHVEVPEQGYVWQG